MARKAAPSATPKATPRTQPRQAPQVLMEEQSFELARIAIAAMVRIRHYFFKAMPGARWIQRGFDPTDSDTSYEAFVSGPASKSTGLIWKVPVPGHNQVDKLLDRLGNGMSDALKRGYLHKVQLSFHQPGPVPLSDLDTIESYILTIAYGSNGTIPYLSTEMRDGQNSEIGHITIADGKKQLQAMVDKILEFLHKTRRSKNNGQFITYSLPAGSKISLQLAYTDATPDEYQPESFHPGNDSTRKILDLDTSSGTDAKMETGFHSVNCTINFPGLGDAAQCLHVASRIVSSSEVPQRNGRDSRDFLTDSVGDPKRIFGSSYNASPDFGRASSRSVHYHSMSRRISRDIPRGSSSMRSVSEGDNTQPDLVAKICQAGSSRVPRAASQDTQQYFTDPASPVANFNIPRYSQDIWNELQHLAQDIATQVGDDDLDAPQSTRVINCECQNETTDEFLVQCGYCKSFQHAECYGYLHNQHDFHFCYSCLQIQSRLSPTGLADRVLDCLARRALRLFQAQGSLVETELSNHLIQTSATTAAVLNALIHEKLVVKNQGASKSQKKKKALATYTLIGDEESIVRAYFDPKKGLYALFPVLTGAFSNPEETAELSHVNRGHPAASYSRGVLTVRGLPNHSRRAKSFDDGTTQSGSSLNTPLGSRSRDLRGHSSERSCRTVSARDNPQTPRIRQPSLTMTISPTESNFSYRLKRLAELSFEQRPAQRRKTGLMSPMLVGAGCLERSIS
ncbi:meiosis specific protein Hop1 [Diplocarpon rosae]|nr:meiosis specific protein Hop1 [Diplocarpon rosae]